MEKARNPPKNPQGRHRDPPERYRNLLIALSAAPVVDVTGVDAPLAFGVQGALPAIRDTNQALRPGYMRVRIRHMEQQPVRVPPLKESECVANHDEFAITFGIAALAARAKGILALMVAQIADVISEEITISAEFSYVRPRAVRFELIGGITLGHPIGGQYILNGWGLCRTLIRFQSKHGSIAFLAT
jgi:hypothetical protein